MEKTKSILKSKIFWLNIIAGLVGFLEVFTPAKVSEIFGPTHSEQALMVIGGITTILNIILRMSSKQPITPIIKKQD